MRWRVENRVTEAAAILLGTAGAFWVGAVVLASSMHLPADAEIASAMEARLVTVETTQAEPSFAATSIESDYAVQGSYVGAVLFSDRGIGVYLDRAVAQSKGTSQPTRLEGIRLSLAEATETGWRLVERGPLYDVGVDMSETTRWAKLSGLSLQLPGVAREDLKDRWLVIEQELWVEESTDGQGHKAWTYVHANPSITDGFVATLEIF